MKNTALILMLILATLGMNIEGQENDNKIHLITGSKIGYNMYDQLGMTHIKTNQGYVAQYNNTMFIELTTGIKWNNLTLIGQYENTFKFMKVDGFAPLRDKFTISLDYQLGDFVFNFTHWCSHTVAMGGLQLPTMVFDGAKRSFSIEYKKVW